MNIIKLDKLKTNIPTALQQATALVINAKAYLDIIQPIAKQVQSELIEKHKPVALEEYVLEGDIENKQITTWNNLFMAGEDVYKPMHAESRELLIQQGFNAKPECCPLLTARSQLREAEKVLIDEMEPYTGINNVMVLYTKDREAYLNIIKPFMVNLCLAHGIDIKEL